MWNLWIAVQIRNKAGVHKYWAPNFCRSSVWNVLHVTFLAHRTLRWLLDFWKNLWTPVINDYISIYQKHVAYCHYFIPTRYRPHSYIHKWMKSKQCYILLNTSDATNNYICERVTIYKTSCTLLPEHFQFSCDYKCKFDFGTNDVNKQLKTTLSTIPSPSRVFWSSYVYNLVKSHSKVT